MNIRFDSDIYPIKVVNRAVQDYSGIAKIRIEREGSSIICTFSDCNYDEKTTTREFANYLIDCINQEKTNDIN